MNRRHFVHAALASPLLLSALKAQRVLASTPARSPSVVGQISPPKREFMATLPRLMELAQLPGLGMGVVQGGRLVWEHYAGVADIQTKGPVGPASLWVAASLSKQVFGYSVLRLADQGKLDLDRPLVEHLAGGEPMNARARRITARHALTHSSGLPGFRQGWEFAPEFEPGTSFQYSGEGIYLLARCVERISGVGFEQFMRQSVFQPLGMTSSTYLWLPRAAAHLVSGHRGGKPWTNRDFAENLYKIIADSGAPLVEWNHDRIQQALAPTSGPEKGRLLPANILYPNAAFSLLTTVSDYAALVGRITTPRGDAQDLKPETRRALMKPYVKVNSALSWGLGWGIEENEGQTYLWQWGANAGAWTSFVLVHPPSESGIMIFTNGGNGFGVIERIVRAATGYEHPVFLWI